MRDMHDGTLIVDRDMTVSGMVSGDVIVRSNCRVTISGMVDGDVWIESGARVEISGMVDGRIHDDSGAASVSGMIGRR